MRARSAGEGGFTLVELLVVVVILGVLSAVVVFAVRGSGDRGEAAAVGSDARVLRTAQEVYCAQYGRYADMGELVGKGLLAGPSRYNNTLAVSGGACTAAGDPDRSGFTVTCVDPGRPGCEEAAAPDPGTVTSPPVWAQQTPTAAPGREGASMAFEGVSGRESRELLFGGYVVKDDAVSDARKATFGTAPSYDFTNEMWSWDDRSWTRLPAPPLSPSPRTDASMAWDPVRKQVVLFGGVGRKELVDYCSVVCYGPELVARQDLRVVNDTWTWDGTTWTPHVTPIAPDGRYGASMAFDTTRGQMLLFGGAGTLDSGADHNDTWAWDGTAWTKLNTPTAPPVRYFAGMAYHAAAQRMVLVGGYLLGPDVWVLNGTTWARDDTASARLGERFSPAMTYDPVRQRVVLFGGNYSPGPFIPNEGTWTWDGSRWDLLPFAPTPTFQDGSQGPATRRIGNMVYDENRQQVILTGGSYDDYSTGYGIVNDTWSWDGTTWTERVPRYRTAFGLARDAARGELVLFGGGDKDRFGGSAGEQALGDTLVLRNGGKWVHKKQLNGPTARTGAVMVYDAARREVVMFGGALQNGGNLSNETWVWNGTEWKQRQPPVRPRHMYLSSMAFDPVRKEVVLFGGYSCTSVTNPTCTQPSTRGETWVWDGTTWTERHPPVSPQARYNPGMAFHEKRGEMILFGGQTNVGGGATNEGRFNDTWSWNGTTWTQLPMATPPPARAYPAMAYDPGRGKVVMFGGSGALGGGPVKGDPYLRDTWTLGADTWERLDSVTTAAEPNPPSGSGRMVYDPTTRKMVLFHFRADTSQLRSNTLWSWG